MGLELRDEIHDGSGIHVPQFVWLKLVALTLMRFDPPLLA
jgi:hypothetical protein